MNKQPNPNVVYPVPGEDGIRKRFDDELIALLEKLKWWDKPIDEIQKLIPLLSDNDLERVRKELRNLV